MRETTINIIDALAARATETAACADGVNQGCFKPDLSEIEAQVIEIRRLLAEFEKLIQDQLQRG